MPSALTGLNSGSPFPSDGLFSVREFRAMKTQRKPDGRLLPARKSRAMKTHRHPGGRRFPAREGVSCHENASPSEWSPLLRPRGSFVPWKRSGSRVVASSPPVREFRAMNTQRQPGSRRFPARAGVSRIRTDLRTEAIPFPGPPGSCLRGGNGSPPDSGLWRSCQESPGAGNGKLLKSRSPGKAAALYA